MTLHTRGEARALDRWAIDRLGVPSIILMENAGRGAAEVLLSLGPGKSLPRNWIAGPEFHDRMNVRNQWDRAPTSVSWGRNAPVP